MNPFTDHPWAMEAAAIVIFASGLGLGWEVNGWRKDVEISALKAEQAAAAKKAEASVRVKEQSLMKQLEDARNEAAKRETAIRADADAARHSADGLRDDLAELRRQLPELAADACRDRADTLAAILNECQGNYRGMAETADRLASDRQTLMDAWPK